MKTTIQQMNANNDDRHLPTTTCRIPTIVKEPQMHYWLKDKSGLKKA